MKSYRIRKRQTKDVQVKRLEELRALVEQLKGVTSPPTRRQSRPKHKAVMTDQNDGEVSLTIQNQKLKRELEAAQD